LFFEVSGAIWESQCLTVKPYVITTKMSSMGKVERKI